MPAVWQCMFFIKQLPAMLLIGALMLATTYKKSDLEVLCLITKTRTQSFELADLIKITYLLTLRHVCSVFHFVITLHCSDRRRCDSFVFRRRQNLLDGIINKNAYKPSENVDKRLFVLRTGFRFYKRFPVFWSPFNVTKSSTPLSERSFGVDFSLR